MIGWGWCGVWCDWLRMMWCVVWLVGFAWHTISRAVLQAQLNFYNFNLQYQCFFLSIYLFVISLDFFIVVDANKNWITTLFLSLFLFRNLGFKANCHFTPVCGCICGCVRHILSWAPLNRFFDILHKIRIRKEKNTFFKYQLLFFLEL